MDQALFLHPSSPGSSAVRNKQEFLQHQCKFNPRSLPQFCPKPASALNIYLTVYFHASTLLCNTPLASPTPNPTPKPPSTSLPFSLSSNTLFTTSLNPSVFIVNNLSTSSNFFPTPSSPPCAYNSRTSFSNCTAPFPRLHTAGSGAPSPRL